MKNRKFKKGDIIVPLPNRKISNGYPLKTIIKAEVVKVSHKRYYDDRTLFIMIKILEENGNYYNNYKPIMFEDAFELATPKEDYSIY